MSIIQSGLILNLDAGNTSSYPRTGTIWTDLSGNNNNGTLINGPTFDSANNGSIVFDGVNKYVDLGNILDYTSGNFSFSYWVNFNSLATNQGGQGPIVIFKGNYNVNGYYDQISTTGNIIFVTNQSGVNQGTSTNSGVISPGNWYNIAYSRNGSSVRIYLNGNDITQAAGTHINPLPSGDNFRLANYANGYIYGNFKLSNLLSYNRNLTATEVLQNYNTTKGRYGTTVQSCLTLNLDAGNTSSYLGTGTLWTDLSGNNNHGTLVNGPTFNSGDGGSITFSNTSNQSVSGTIILSPSFTVEVIFMPITMGDYAPVFTVGLNNGSGSWGDFVLHTTATGAIYCGTDIATRLTPSDTGCGPGTFLVNNIYHMTFTFSDGIGSLYKNGVLLKSKVMTKPLNGSTPGPYRIQNISGFASSMRVYDFRIHCKALTSEEVQQNYKPTTPDCEIIAGGTEVFPNSGTTTFTALYESTCAGGEVSNGPTTGMTITKVGKNGIDTYLITAIPSKGSIFKGWNENGRRTAGTNIYVITYTQLSVNFTISDNTTWFAIFDNDCSNIDIPFCFNINKDNLCLSCNEQKQVYFNNINNQFINNGSNIITSTWFSSANFESLITYEKVSNTTRQPFTFNFSSAGVAGAGTFTDVYLSGFKSGKLCTCCSNNLTHKYLSLTCTPSNKNISYTIFLYTNGVKTNTFVRTGDSYINVISYKSDPNQYNNTYKMTYLVSSVMTIDFYASTESIFHYSDCFGGGDNSFQSGVYTRTKNSGSYTTDGWYTQLINGQYSDYNIIYRVYEGQVIDIKDCRSDILDCNG